MAKLVNHIKQADETAVLGQHLRTKLVQHRFVGDFISLTAEWFVEALKALDPLLASHAVLRYRLRAAAEIAFEEQIVQTQMLESELEQVPGVSAAEFKEDWMNDWIESLDQMGVRE